MPINQIRILCENCGCYYFWDVDSEFVGQNSKEAGTHCPECGSQEMAAHAHHSAGVFNAEAVNSARLPRYFSGPGSNLEPIEVKAT